jgi:TetR/AcrR family transcriptional regulator of autoinduction and epiphytic fitness
MTAQSDGRSARRARNRQEVVDAALALLDEGIADPSIEQLTERSGLSARSIYRYFDGLDDLRRAVIRRHFERVEPLLHVDGTGDGSLDTRIKRFVEARLKFNQAVEGPARTVRMRQYYAPMLAEEARYYRSVLDAAVRRHFAPELKTRTKSEAEDLVAIIDVLVSFDAWDVLVHDHGRSRAQVRRLWTSALEALLG